MPIEVYYQDAGREFSEAERNTQAASLELDVLLNRGYVLVAAMLEKHDDDAVRKELEGVKGQLEPLEYGQDFIEQLETAYRFFSKNTSRNRNE